ncbi:hypothetical protein D0Y65_000759 [Glycine soja]|uniref:Uncharacterized protein n=1 Tax=Glycine soja TaxID=3848 RepID=A0A445M010_GLYSO|nr:hypothetical protein D0Y65_000759 [Glycine soja]
MFAHSIKGCRPLGRACGVLIPSPCVNTTPEPFNLKVRRSRLFRFFRRFPQINVGGDSARIPFVEHASRESRVALPPKGRLRHLLMVIANETMNENCLLISLNGHGESEGDMFILGILDVFNEFRNSGVRTPNAGLSSSSDLSTLSTLQFSFSSMGTGIANLECVVLPPGSNNDAIPLEATVKTIPPLDRIVDDKVFQINVFLVPP